MDTEVARGCTHKLKRNEAIELVKSHVDSRNLVNHMIATGAVMRSLAEKLGHDAELWEVAGILHDYDYPETKDTPQKHGVISVQLLKEHDLPQDVYDAILAHCDKKPRVKPIEKAIYAADPTTGFVVAAALIRPEKKLEPLDVKFLTKKFKQRAFAKGASREQMQTCSEIGLNLEEFFGLALDAMKGIHEEIGL